MLNVSKCMSSCKKPLRIVVLLLFALLPNRKFHKKKIPRFRPFVNYKFIRGVSFCEDINIK